MKWPIETGIEFGRFVLSSIFEDLVMKKAMKWGRPRPALKSLYRANVFFKAIKNQRTQAQQSSVTPKIRKRLFLPKKHTIFPSRQ